MKFLNKIDYSAGNQSSLKKKDYDGKVADITF